MIGIENAKYVYKFMLSDIDEHNFMPLKPFARLNVLSAIHEFKTDKLKEAKLGKLVQLNQFLIYR